MIELVRGIERGKTSLDWLKSWHSFSFGEYYDPSRMGFGPLRVINEDIVAPGGGFPPHPHRDMEIITYILEGELEHTDSMGNGSVITAGEIQKMSAGTGITHSEFNPSKTHSVHLLQIWIQPDQKRLTPMYQQQKLHVGTDKLFLLGSNEGDAPIDIHQDVRVYAFKTTRDISLTHQLGTGYIGWLQLARGNAKVGEHAITGGDAIAISDLQDIVIEAQPGAEGLLFEMRKQ